MTGEPGTPTTVLTEWAAESYLAATCWTPTAPTRVGVELEWLVYDRRDPTAAVSHERVRAAAERAALGFGRLTFEPGGQVEYSSRPAAGLAACVERTLADMALLRAAVDGAGLRLAGYGIDPYRAPNRILDQPRYAAMQEYFRRGGPAGRQMMGCSASVQVCLDAGQGGEVERRWALAHALGPVLVASFANSPVWRSEATGWRSEVTGWRSTRQAIWARMDASRTSPVLAGSPLSSGDSVRDWIRYVMQAQVMCIRRPAPQRWLVPEGLTLRDWIRSAGPPPPNGGGSNTGQGLPAVTVDDVDYHVSTLFPPVRPRGYLELRMIDAQPGDGWVVPLAVATTLMDVPEAADRAREAAAACWERAAEPAMPWRTAARSGLADPTLARAARECFAAAIDALAPGPARTSVERFAERYVERGRCPADEFVTAA